MYIYISPFIYIYIYLSIRRREKCETWCSSCERKKGQLLRWLKKKKRIFWYVCMRVWVWAWVCVCLCVWVWLRQNGVYAHTHTRHTSVAQGLISKKETSTRKSHKFRPIFRKLSVYGWRIEPTRITGISNVRLYRCYRIGIAPNCRRKKEIEGDRERATRKRERIKKNETEQGTFSKRNDKIKTNCTCRSVAGDQPTKHKS